LSTDEYLVAGGHNDVLANGRPIAPGDIVPADQVNLESEHDQALVAGGALVDVTADRKASGPEQTGDDSASQKPKRATRTGVRPGDAENGADSAQKEN
jgi:hypothetical protein